MVLKVVCIIMDSQAILEVCLWYFYQIDGFGRSSGVECVSCELEEYLDIFGGLACYFMVVEVPCINMDPQAIFEGCLWFLH